MPSFCIFFCSDGPGEKMTACQVGPVRLGEATEALIKYLAGASALRSDNTDARYRQGAQGTDTEHLQAGSRQTAKDHGRKPGVSLLARSKRGTRFRTMALFAGTRHILHAARSETASNSWKLRVMSD